jgi:hypothetical protein
MRQKMMEQVEIGRFTVEAQEWKNHGKHRIYFTLSEGGKACYDVIEKRFIKCRNRVGARFEHAIKIAFELESEEK